MSISTTTSRATSAGSSSAIAAFRRVGRRGLLLDTLVGIVLAGLVVANAYLFMELADAAQLESPTALTFASGLVMCLALALRRVYPITVFVIVSVAFTVYGFNQGYDALVSSVAMFIATVSAGSHGRPVVRDWARGIVIAGLFGTIFYAFYGADGPDVPLAAAWFGQVYVFALNIFYFAAAWIFGDQIRIRREREAQLEQRTSELAARSRELEAERERSAERAAVDERLRIARELHDVLGHHVSVIGVQAGAARRALERDPRLATETLGAVERSARQAVTEVQRVLRLLREDREPRGPLGALSRLEEIADEMRRAGIAVTVQVGELPTLPVEVDLAAVRVVQESLTNVLRHAGPGSSAWVKVRVDDGAIEVEVTDDGRGAPLEDPRDRSDAGADRGTGLRGMRERVEVHGGVFRVGPTRDGGWQVTARIPYDLEGSPSDSPGAVTTEPHGAGVRP